MVPDLQNEVPVLKTEMPDLDPAEFKPRVICIICIVPQQRLNVVEYTGQPDSLKDIYTSWSYMSSTMLVLFTFWVDGISGLALRPFYNSPMCIVLQLVFNLSNYHPLFKIEIKDDFISSRNCNLKVPAGSLFQSFSLLCHKTSMSEIK